MTPFWKHTLICSLLLVGLLISAYYDAFWLMAVFLLVYVAAILRASGKLI